MSLEDIPHCDVFYPTEEEFKNFEKYVSKCEKQARSGIIKIVPPKGWTARKDNYKNMEFSIPYPIEQIVTGSAGVYEVFLIQREARALSKYKKLVECFDQLTAGKSPLEIEKMFWKNLKLSAPLYGADSPGSIFDKGRDWNLSELKTILKKGLSSNGILGVTSPYMYIGAWKTLFAWHKEDMDLYSINYLHLGKPKYWYAIPLEDSLKFEEFMKKSYPEAYKECPEFLRHKTYLVHPEVLMKNGIKLHRCYQNSGEFVITLAGGYHSGFNVGFNLAEAVNFALKRWIEVGKNAKPCKCRGDSVNINMEEFLSNLSTRCDDDEKYSETRKRKKKSVKTQKVKNKQPKIKVTTSEDQKTIHWMKCFDCKKWRKVKKNFHMPEKKSKFTCCLIKKMNCNEPEENWRKKRSTNKTLRISKRNSTTVKRKKMMTLKDSKKGVKKKIKSASVHS